MKQINTLKKFLVVTGVAIGSLANAQTQHPKAFGAIGTFPSNFYKDYVGVRFEVNSPAFVAGDKQYTTSNDGSGATGLWGAAVTTPIINTPIIMPQAGDSLVDNPITVSMTGKIAFVYRGGGVYFSDKAYRAQLAGAIACVIVNNQPGGPVGMGAGTSGGLVTIPVFMISKEDGDAIDGAYNSGYTVGMTITPWGLNNQNDLGFVPAGVSRWHNWAVPANQLISSGNPDAYKGVDGAFVANYGSHNATNVILNSNVTFTPNGGSATAIHSGSVALGSFPASDSIYAMYAPQYDLSSITGNGEVRVKYSITSDSTDQYMGDDSTSYAFYTTDSLYSKGRYDFTNGFPIANHFLAAGQQPGDEAYIWGNMYFVNKVGAGADRIQWRMSSNTDTAGTITSISQVHVYLFKWNDGKSFAGQDTAGPNGLIQNGELELIGAGIRSFGGSSTLAGDTSGGVFTAVITDSNASSTAKHPLLEANTWYYAAVEVPNVSGSTWFLGCDGHLNTYPRVYGRDQFFNALEYASPVWASDRYAGTNAQVNTFSSHPAPCPFGGNFYPDSVVFSSQKGLIPAVPLFVNNHPDTTTSGGGTGGSGVKQVSGFAKFELFPNPATNYVNVALGLNSTAKEVTYTVIDAAARVIGKESHKNVQSETYQFNTSRLAAGHYFMVVSADDKIEFKKFTVIR